VLRLRTRCNAAVLSKDKKTGRGDRRLGFAEAERGRRAGDVCEGGRVAWGWNEVARVKHNAKRVENVLGATDSTRSASFCAPKQGRADFSFKPRDDVFWTSPSTQTSIKQQNCIISRSLQADGEFHLRQNDESWLTVNSRTQNSEFQFFISQWSQHRRP
jgi:hypothetical protein